MTLCTHDVALRTYDVALRTYRLLCVPRWLLCVPRWLLCVHFIFFVKVMIFERTLDSFRIGAMTSNLAYWFGKPCSLWCRCWNILFSCGYFFINLFLAFRVFSGCGTPFLEVIFVQMTWNFAGACWGISWTCVNYLGIFALIADMIIGIFLTSPRRNWRFSHFWSAVLYRPPSCTNLKSLISPPLLKLQQI